MCSPTPNAAPATTAIKTQTLGRPSFWTACPYCWSLFEYEKRYEDCSLLCQVCGKAFQGVPVKPPTKLGDAVVEGEEPRQHYSCEASVPLMYYEVKGNNGLAGQNIAPFVYISDDDNDDGGFVRNEGLQQGILEKRRMRVKTVANKVSGNRRRRLIDSGDSDFDLDVEDGDFDLV